MSVLVLVLLSMTPIAAMGVLLGIGRFEHYLLEGYEAEPGLAEEVPAAPITSAAAPEPLAQASRPAA